MNYVTEQEAKGGTLPRVLANAVKKHGHKLSKNRDGLLAVDRDSGFATPSGMAWDCLLAAGWRTNDGGHRAIIEGNAATAAYLIRNAERCYCDHCFDEQQQEMAL